MTRARVIVIVVCALVVITTALIAAHGVSLSERALFRRINDSPDWLEPPLRAVMQFGTFLFVGLVIVGLLVARRWRAALAGAIAVPLAWGVTSFLKHLIDRDRPLDVMNEVVVRGMRNYHLGYPSAHATIAFALATIVAATVPARWRAPIWLIAVLVAVARVYVGAHFPLDVVGGAAVGIGVATLVQGVVVSLPHE